MANPVKGEASLKLKDGRQFVIVMDMEALVEAETAYGKPLAQLMADVSGGFVGASRALLYGSLRANHPDVSLRDASGLFMADPDAVSQALNDAVESGFPDASAEGNVPKPQRGKNSGRSGAKQG